MNNDIFKIDDEFKDSESGTYSTNADDKGNLDDSMLSDDFIIGQDFFIDSAEADSITTEELRKAPKKKRRKKRKSAGTGCLMSVIWMAAILVISISAASLILYFGMDYLGVSLAADSAEDNIEVVINPGTSTKKIAQMLEDKGVISSPMFFRLFASQGGYASKFHDGIYYFSKQDSYEDIADKLIKQGAQAEQVKVTIPEGWDIDKIAERLELNKVCTASQFKQAVNEATYEKYSFEFMKGIKDESQGVHYRLEGYLFPDTYYFYQTNNKNGAEQAIKKMLQNFDSKLDQGMRLSIEERGLTIHDVVTMASMVEMEASVASYSDKQRVSAVFWNRINSNGKYPYLQSDPTAKYKYNTDRYNTYKAKGLAPGAYCSPGEKALRAAIDPTKGSQDYFFVTDKNMKFYFNTTNEAHNETIKTLKNKGLWVEAEKQ